MPDMTELAEIESGQLVDLTRYPVKFDITFTKSDVILIATTGGVGWLIKEVVRYAANKSNATIDTQTANLRRLMEDAAQAEVGELLISVHPEVPILLPRGTEIEELDRTRTRVRYRLRFSWSDTAYA